MRAGSLSAWILLASTCLFSTNSAASETTTYTYDALGRLVQVSNAGTINNGLNSAYSYDPAGNRSNVTVTGGGVIFSIGDVSGAEGGSLQFTVTKSGATTDSFTVNYTTADGTATAGSDYNSATNSLVFAPSDTSKTVTVTTVDDAVYEGNETFYVNISGAAGATISDSQGIGTIIENETPPSLCGGISFTIANNGAVTEGANSVFTVTKTGTTTNSCNVNYATADGTAIAPGDYTAKSGTLTFTSGQASQTVNVTTVDNGIVDGNRTLSMGLSSPTDGATLGTPSSATATINDNDVAPTCGGVSFTIASNGAVTEGTNSGFTITKSGTTTNSCSVNYGTANGTATAPGDYTTKSGTLTFTSAQTSQIVNVTTIDDSTVESAETLTMSLSSPTGGSSVGTPGSATATINDNDNQPPVANADSMSVKICENGTKNVTANDTDPNGDPITLTAVTSSALVDAFVLDNATVSVTAYGTTGNTQVTYTISDGHGGTANGTLGITVLNGTGCMLAPPAGTESNPDPTSASPEGDPQPAPSEPGQLGTEGRW